MNIRHESRLEELLSIFLTLGENSMSEDEFKELIQLVWDETGIERIAHYLRIQNLLLMTMTKEIKNKKHI